MAYINTYIFRAEVPKLSLLEFMSRTPPEYYIFLVPAGPYVYGLFINNDVVEYFTNEFKVVTFEIVQLDELMKVMDSGCKLWGNRELLSI
jgi:hypothetical protein